MNPACVMTKFTESLGECLGEFHNVVVYEVKTKLHPDIKHNHVPVRFLVDNCEYCQKYGNCLAPKA